MHYIFTFFLMENKSTNKINNNNNLFIT